MDIIDIDSDQSSINSLEQDWESLCFLLTEYFGKKPDLKAVLFLIGVQELGQGARNFSKEEKQDLMHIAVCRVLSTAGIYELEGRDEEGWPHWKLCEKVPHMDFFSQEKLLKIHIIDYFKENQLFL